MIEKKNARALAGVKALSDAGGSLPQHEFIDKVNELWVRWGLDKLYPNRFAHDQQAIRVVDYLRNAGLMTPKVTGHRTPFQLTEKGVRIGEKIQHPESPEGLKKYDQLLES